MFPNFNQNLPSKQEILPLIKNGNIHSMVLKKFKKENPQYKDITIQNLYYIYNEIKSPIKCKMCDNEVSWISFKKGFRKYCSDFCSSNDDEFKNKVKETNIKRYGFDCPAKQIIPKTNKEYKRKIQYNIIEGEKPTKEDIEHLVKNNSIHSLVFKKFKSINSNKNFTIQDLYYIYNDINKPIKCKNCGGEVSWISFKKGFRNYCSDLCSSNSTESKKKVKDSSLKKYGVYNYNYINIKNKKEYIDIIDRLEKKENFYEILKNFINKDIFLIEKMAKYFNISISSIRNLQKKYKINLINETIKLKEQKNIYDFIISLNKKENIEKIHFNDRKIIKPYELDIYDELNRIAIEYNGLMYHSFGLSKHSKFNNLHRKDKYYKTYNNKKYFYKDKHLLKTDICEDNNIKLFHIFENEWFQKRNIWEYIIKREYIEFKDIDSLKNKQIKILSKNETFYFFKENYLLDVNLNDFSNTYNLALYLNGSIIFVICFKNEEIIYLCYKQNTYINGVEQYLINRYNNLNKYDKIKIRFDRRFESIERFITTNGKQENNIENLKNTKTIKIIPPKEYILNNYDFKNQKCLKINKSNNVEKRVFFDAGSGIIELKINELTKN